MLNVVLAGALARPFVHRKFIAIAASFGSREICETNHLPDRANTIAVTLGWNLEVPSIETHAAEMINEHRLGSVLLRPDHVRNAFRAVLGVWQGWIVDHGILAKVHVLTCGTGRRALPLQGLESREIVDAWKDGVGAVALSTKGVRCIHHLLLEKYTRSSLCRGIRLNCIHWAYPKEK